MEQQDIKYALRNYNDLKKWVKHANNQLEVIQTKMEGVGGSIIKKSTGTTNRDRFMLNHIERKDRVRKRIEMYDYYYSIANEFIEWLPIELQNMCIDKYINGFSGYDLEDKYCYSQRHISRLINKAIDDYIEAT